MPCSGLPPGPCSVRDDRKAESQQPPAVWFAYSPDRKGIHPQHHLAGDSGILQADAYGGYNALYEDGRITEAACMAHTRRKIHDVHARTPTDITTEALKRIGKLYAIEAEIRGSPAAGRLAVRKEQTVPLMQSLYDWIQVQMKVLSRHSDTAKAFAYLLKQWGALNLYCSNGWAEIRSGCDAYPLPTDVGFFYGQGGARFWSCITRKRQPDNYPYFIDYACTFCFSLLRIPLSVYLPGRCKAGTRLYKLTYIYILFRFFYRNVSLPNYTFLFFWRLLI